MTLRPFDFFLAFVLLFGLAFWARHEHRRLVLNLRGGRNRARIDSYKRTLAMQWSLVGLVGLHWILLERDFRDLLLDVRSSWAVWICLAVVLILTIFLLTQLRSVIRSAEAREEARAALDSIRDLLPASPDELRLFNVLAITAGICEEILYRGFLPWFLAHWVPMWAAFAIAVAGFGFGHLYQGTSGVFKTAGLGLVMAALAWWSGSLLPAILLHAAIDLINGRLAFVAITTFDPPTESSSVDAAA